MLRPGSSPLPASAGAVTIGPLLRDWRRRRRLSQLDLALEAGVSARHISFVESGRARPSAEMVLRLAEQLDVPLRDRNGMLLAAGHAPLFVQRELDEPQMAPARDAIGLLLDGHEPYPAVVVDRAWERLAANAAVGLLLERVAPHLLSEPVNVLRVSLHPEGMAPQIINFGEWRAHLLSRLRRQLVLTGDPALATLLEEIRGYPGPDGGDADDAGRLGEIAVALRLRTSAGELALISTIATFGTAVEITTSELSIESFFPADKPTAAALRDYARA